jgi:predicted membrane metal-binding protein
VESAQPVSEKAHLFCLHQLPLKSHALSELKALVCAENFNTLSNSQLYISSGLIHLFVVSGAHLILIEKLLQKLPEDYRPNKNLLLALLIAYGFLCNLNAPITRSLVTYSVSFFLNSKKINWPPHFKIFISGLLTLLLNYHWLSSLSLQMSWMAGLLVAVSTLFFQKKSLFFKQSLFFLMLLPTLVFFQLPSFIVVLCNLVLAPLLEFVLFPLGLAVWFFNFLYPVFDYFIILFRTLLQKLELDFLVQPATTPPQLIFFNWLLILIAHLLFHLLYVSQKRRHL